MAVVLDAGSADSCGNDVVVVVVVVIVLAALGAAADDVVVDAPHCHRTESRSFCRFVAVAPFLEWLFSRYVCTLFALSDPAFSARVVASDRVLSCHAHGRQD